jgi:hypothetical protein
VAMRCRWLLQSAQLRSIDSTIQNLVARILPPAILSSNMAAVVAAWTLKLFSKAAHSI